MANKLRSINNKLTKSTEDFDRVMTSILPQEKPLAGPSYYSEKANDVQKYNQVIKNPEEPLRSTLRLKDIAESHLKKDHENELHNYKITQPHFYTPNKQKTKANNIKNPESFTASRFKNGNREHSLYREQPAMHKSSIQYSRGPGQKIVREAKVKNIVDLDPQEVLRHTRQRPPLSTSSTPEDIFDYFYELVPFFEKPLIKKYKNCLFFGEGPRGNGSTRYTGFLYFFNSKIYYGNFQNDHKHGQGIQINIEGGKVFKGTFDKGHKVGKFEVTTPDEEYVGHLNKGQYHGRGKLQTKISVYEGSFYNGWRHGYGEELFLKSGLKLTGLFQMGQFSNRPRVEQTDSNKNIKKRKPEQNNLSNILQFEFHDQSEDQAYETPRIRRISRRKPQLTGIESSALLESAEEESPLPSYFRRFIK